MQFMKLQKLPKKFTIKGAQLFIKIICKYSTGIFVSFLTQL